MKLFYSVLILMMISFTLNAQKNIIIKPENADCENAILLNDSINGPSTPPLGFGSIMEITGKRMDNHFLEKEHNSVWYTFTIRKSGNLKFDIIPVDADDDYDFLLFKYTDKNFCKDVREKKINPIRNNISRRDSTQKGITGISPKGKSDFVHSGPGDVYSRHLFVHKDEVYYLLVDNVYPKGKGHYVNINLLNKSDKIPVKIEKKDKIINKIEPIGVVNNKGFTINVNVTDRETSELLNAKIKILENSKLIKEFVNTSSCFYAIKAGKKYSVEVTLNGYMSSTTEIAETEKNKQKILNISLDKIKKGRNIVIENIYFISNSAEITKESIPALDNLFKSLTDNPGLKIEIQGHVNGPGLGVNEYMGLSINRAKAVMDYLVIKGVSKTRLSFKGFSNLKMIYPKPENDQQSAKNRRVEILIVSEK